jgi:hypothetical protein
MKDSTMTDGLLDKFLLDVHDLIAMGGGASLVMELDRAGDSLPEKDSSCSWIAALYAPDVIRD